MPVLNISVPENKITYLVGAGASQQCLPIVSKMSEEILLTIQWFSNAAGQSGYRSIQNGKANILKSILDDLTALAEICKPDRNFSIDTYAKKLKISGRENEYIKLKDTLTLFFTLQQRRKFPDVRYDNFWASLLNKKDELPGNIKILSWNYDFQFELSYQDFIQSDSLRDSANTLNLITQKTPVERYKSIDEFQIFKLNGSATYNSEAVKNVENYVVNDVKTCSNSDAFEKIFNYYTSRNVEIQNHLSYAWEHDISNKFFEHLIDCIQHTNTLVIIGYSFPFFNRIIDKKILKSMQSLRKVYFQDPNAAVIEERFSAIRGVTTYKLVPDTYQFVLPNEL
jgi:hypothetical protein